MQHRVERDSVRTFTTEFYRSLGNESGGRVDVAMNDARRAVFWRHRDAPWNWPAAVLFLRGEGLLLQPAPSPVPADVDRDRRRPPVHIAEHPEADDDAYRPPSRPPPAPLELDRWQRLRQRARDLLDRAWELGLDDEHLRNICYVLDVEYDDLGGTDAASRFRELVRLCEGDNKALDALESAIERQGELRWSHQASRRASIKYRPA
jgi:hypothetical protein